MTGIRLKTLPESICRLKLLKYLNLSGSRIKVLPESIIYLQNLQVLLLRSCENLYKLPKGLRYMRNLLHLDIENCFSLKHLPAGIKYLTNLGKLPQFHVGKEKNRAKIGELVDLNLLEDCLEITQLENVGGLVEAKSANLKSKTKLSKLELTWSSRIFETRSEQEIIASHEEVLEGLEPNQCLEKWSLYCYRGKSISPTWWVKLNDLVEIVFHECKNCEYLPPLGKLPNLRLIALRFMDSLKGFHDDDTNVLGDNANMFLSLEILYISSCPNLVSLPSNLPKLNNLDLDSCEGLVSLPGNLPKLAHLTINMSNKLVSLPGNLPVLEELELTDCKELVSLPGNLPELEWLSIIMSNKLASLTSNLPKLKNLILSSCEVLVSLPASLPVLEVLDLSHCKESVSFPGILPNIRKLKIFYCDGFRSIPDEILSYKNLTELEIVGCIHLRGRCEKETGEDWHKISHIPNIRASH